MNTDPYEELSKKLDQLLALALEIRNERREYHDAAEATGISGSIIIPTEVLGPLPVEAHGWITPLSAGLGANVRKSTDVGAALSYVLAYGDSREVQSSIKVTAPNGQEFTWYILADNNVVRGDVVDFSKEKPVAPSVSGLYPCPTKYDVVTSEFTSEHTGWDLATYNNRIGEPIYAGPNGGRVVQSRENGWNDGFGSHVVVRYEYKDLPFGFRSMLPEYSYVFVMHAHLSEVKCAVGKVLGANSLIGLMGSTGHSSGPHLHLETRHSTDAQCAFWKATLFDPARMYQRNSR